MSQIQPQNDQQWTKISLVDTEAIDRERVIGRTQLADDYVLVRVAQRVDFDLLGVPIGKNVHRPRIAMGELFELDSRQARTIAGDLLAAADFFDVIAQTEAQQRL
ncbi:hypothetical protein [Kineosporia sp. NBRC 101731]|uniref:hypothetical protein n=1 Tax=Kineosporia sp. NBRC 101731 TaxID=3032199 RepID=UPI0024A1C5D6|nr:hypothetical protein [Kineosporia sp. NBRC 101731]GLY32549.1 hypothetical protein Kisp02_59140 [Kineosporia sp. NBRC 101731]